MSCPSDQPMSPDLLAPPLGGAEAVLPRSGPWHLPRNVWLHDNTGDDDIEREIREHKQAITAMERLRGSRVVVAGETVVTVCRASRKTEKRLLRAAR